MSNCPASGSSPTHLLQTRQESFVPVVSQHKSVATPSIVIGGNPKLLECGALSRMSACLV